MRDFVQIDLLTNEILLWLLAGLIFVIGFYILTILLLDFFFISKTGKSPFTNLPLRKGKDLSFFAREKLFEYFQTLPQPYNQPPDFEKIAICKSTGRIFPNSVTTLGRVKTPTNPFSHYPGGDYLLWQELSESLKAEVSKRHTTFRGYQQGQLPKHFEKQKVNQVFSRLKPGPLFVNLKTMGLLGWKSVPETHLEILVYQPPTKVF